MPVAQPQFSSILDRPSADVERPKPLPQGTYICVVEGMPRYDKSSRKGTDFAEFTLKVIQADEDVDADDLKAVGGGVGKTIRATYYLTEDALWRLKVFLDDCGVEEGKHSLRRRAEMAAGHQVGVFIKHEATDDGAVFARVNKTMPVE